MRIPDILDLCQTTSARQWYVVPGEQHRMVHKHDVALTIEWDDVTSSMDVSQTWFEDISELGQEFTVKVLYNESVVWAVKCVGLLYAEKIVYLPVPLNAGEAVDTYHIDDLSYGIVEKIQAATNGVSALDEALSVLGITMDRFVLQDIVSTD